MKIRILGIGCPKCKKLAGHVGRAVAALGVAAEIVKVTDINEMMKLGVMLTPALVIDGQVKSVGEVPSVEQITAMLS